MSTVSQDHPPKRRLDALDCVSPDVFIFNIPVWNPTYEAFKIWWDKMIASSERNNLAVCLANAFTFNHTSRHLEFRDSVRNMDVVINDGMGYRIASSMRGVHTQYNFNGTDLIPRLLEEAKSPIKVFFYGASENSNREAVKTLQTRYPMLEVVGRVNGYVSEEEAIKQISASNADVLLVAMGHPKQEIFIIKHRDKLNVKVAFGVGGLFDFVSGTKPRAPKKIRDWGFEWVFRLLIEPRRMFRRYVIGNPIFIIRCFWYLRRDMRRMRSSGSSSTMQKSAPTEVKS